MFFMEDHMNPAGYVLMADMVCAYIDYIIRHNMRDFDEIGFIGTQLTNHPCCTAYPGELPSADCGGKESSLETGSKESHHLPFTER